MKDPIITTDPVHGTVNEIIRAHPATVEVFNRFGIDSCCGGAVSVVDAATRDGADPDELRRAIRMANGEM